MKKRKMNNDLKPRVKQEISLDKAITIATVTVSGKYHLGELNEDQCNNKLQKKLKEIQRRYGFWNLKTILPTIIKRMEEKPTIILNLENKDTNVILKYEYLKEYLKWMEE